jgi:hypothetical protein
MGTLEAIPNFSSEEGEDVLSSSKSSSDEIGRRRDPTPFSWTALDERKGHGRRALRAELPYSLGRGVEGGLLIGHLLGRAMPSVASWWVTRILIAGSLAI